MSVAELLLDLNHYGVRVTPRGEWLVVDAPKGVVTPELCAALETHKSELLRFLQPEKTDQQPRVNRGTCLFCGRPLSALRPPGEWLRCSDCGRQGRIVPLADKPATGGVG